MESKENPLTKMVGKNGEVPSPVQVKKQQAEECEFRTLVRSIDEVGDYVREEEDPNVLVYGPWLERGGSAFWISTAGTGKSIASIQLAHCMSAGIPFCGLKPRGKLKFWIFQSEDSPRRVAQDRLDVRAELAEQHPDIDWSEVGKTVKTVKLTGKVSVAFLVELDRLLGLADTLEEKPDVVLINPLLAFVGGPVTDGSYVTPFLRGGSIDGKETCGLQAILERRNVGVLVFHHTPKPPSEKELDAWMKSRFPEYQGAGSSDITNWGRSFVTMMRVKGHSDMMCVTAGKNGAELGWEQVGGAYRHYIAFSDATGVSGKRRHAWRELTPDEYDDVVGKAKTESEKDATEVIDAMVAHLKQEALSKTELGKQFAGVYSRDKIRTAVGTIFANPGKYRLTVKPVLRGRGWTQYIGQAEGLQKVVEEAKVEVKYEAQMARQKDETAQNGANVDAVEPTVDPQTAQPPVETPQEDADGWF